MWVTVVQHSLIGWSSAAGVAARVPRMRPAPFLPRQALRRDPPPSASPPASLWQGDTPLHEASLNGHVEIVRALVGRKGL